MDAERVFELDEAKALLPALRSLLTQLADMQAELRGGGRRVLSGNGSGSAARALATTEHRYASILREIHDMGVIVRDLATGLVDFAALRDAEPIYLCWRRDEPDIGWWHPRETGIAGRRPL